MKVKTLTISSLIMMLSLTASATIIENWQFNDGAGVAAADATNSAGTADWANLGADHVLNSSGQAVFSGDGTSYYRGTTGFNGGTPIINGTVYLRADLSEWDIAESASGKTFCFGFANNANKLELVRLNKGVNDSEARISVKENSSSSSAYITALSGLGLSQSAGISMILGVDLDNNTLSVWTYSVQTGDYTQQITDLALAADFGEISTIRFEAAGMQSNDTVSTDMLVVGDNLSEIQSLQKPAPVYLAFEAENFDINHSFVYTNENEATFDVQWAEATNAAASGGSSMLANGLGFSQGATNEAYLSYTLTFTKMGSYHLYTRVKTEDGANNSMYYAKNFDTDPTAGNFATLGGTVTNGYHWDLYNQYAANFTIDESNVNTPVTFSVKIRETLFELDRIVFSTDLSLQDSDLDSLINNTPTNNTGPSDPFHIESLSLSNGAEGTLVASVGLSSVNESAAAFVLEYTPDLTSSNWVPVATNLLQTPGGTLIHSNASESTAGFYRITAE